MELSLPVVDPDVIPIPEAYARNHIISNKYEQLERLVVS